ncbi:glutamate 5-kinase [Bradyrhizobium sp. DASA03068]|uniref:glutamate 5-kinase n=1 Tax=Bradyrhizobium sp. BLXBL-01 TaxID=3395915 RepID=UPI003F72F673
MQQDSIAAIANSVQLLSAARLIVKIGSGLVFDADTGEIRGSWLETLIEDVARFVGRGQQVIIVTSGAVAAGSRRFCRSDRRLQAEEKQAAAAIGQVQLMIAYEQSLKHHGFAVGQLLLTAQDIDNRHRYLNVRSTLQQLLKVGAVPVVNENDATATTDICFGDNDRLAARVAEMVNADVLILLSSVDGLFTEDPQENQFARMITEVRCITPEIQAMAGHSTARHGSGGMVTKLMAASMVMDVGCEMVISNGSKPYPLAAIENGGPSTWFFPLAKDKGGHDACANCLPQA